MPTATARNQAAHREQLPAVEPDKAAAVIKDGRADLPRARAVPALAAATKAAAVIKDGKAGLPHAQAAPALAADTKAAAVIKGGKAGLRRTQAAPVPVAATKGDKAGLHRTQAAPAVTSQERAADLREDPEDNNVPAPRLHYRYRMEKQQNAHLKQKKPHTGAEIKNWKWRKNSFRLKNAPPFWQILFQNQLI
ncbi:hypothetical protein FACS189494_06650 [Spirochaetia bacterium]|nr:hypothetical protein FACS189494_06650 [Spirochaetia bacterium]